MKMLQKGTPVSVIDLAHSNRSCGRHIGGIISARRTVAFDDRTWFQPDLDDGLRRALLRRAQAARNRCSLPRSTLHEVTVSSIRWRGRSRHPAWKEGAA